MIYLIGTLPSMIAVGMNPFINAQGYALIGMSSVAVGAAANLLLDPLFIFVLGLGVEGAAIATVISQFLSAAFVLYFLMRKAELKVRLLRKYEFRGCFGYAKNIVSLGTAGFIMQLTNSLGSFSSPQRSASHRARWSWG
jgi:Na+-driven multidrug efflux pump